MGPWKITRVIGIEPIPDHSVGGRICFGTLGHTDLRAFIAVDSEILSSVNS